MSTPIASLGYRLKQAQHLLRNAMDEALRPLGLTTPQYAVLSQLERRPGISNASLARASFITPQTMHGIVVNLEKNRCVLRKKDPGHGRVICTELTKQGKALVEKAHLEVEALEQEMMRSFNLSQKRMLSELLGECIENLRA